MPPRNRRGTEPRTARSPLRLRVWIAGGALLIALLGITLTAAVALDDSSDLQTRATVAALLLVAVAVSAVVDLVVVRARMRRGDKG